MKTSYLYVITRHQTTAKPARLCQFVIFQISLMFTECDCYFGNFCNKTNGQCICNASYNGPKCEISDEIKVDGKIFFISVIRFQHSMGTKI